MKFAPPLMSAQLLATPVPVPVSAAFVGEPAAFVVNVRFALREPTFVGVKVTDTTQFALAARVPPHVFAEIEKSPAFDPVSAMLEIVRVALPTFVSVMLCALVGVPTVSLPNAK